ncbi:MAG: response regulator, partial [Sulfurimicrobium sp.]|nr:response regulator [Sulfurimicrobium sp.]
MKTLPILIVEDDRDLREALCDTLALSGYEAISAADGVIALEMLRRRTVGLVVTDVQMQPM